VKTFKLFTMFLLLAAGPAAAASVAVYHTSDAHGWYAARPALWDKENSTRTIGGFAAIAALLEKETTPYLLLDAGDMWQGTPEGILTKGQASVTLMNQLGYVAAVPGNHDYDSGEAPLKAMISSAAFTVLGANIYLKDGSRAPYLKPYIMVERAGRRLAVLGLAGAHTANNTLPAHVRHLEFRDEAVTAAALLPEIKKERPDAVIALVHLGLDENLSLKRVDISTWTFTIPPPGTLAVARAAAGIDLLLGGHNHTGLLRGWRDPVSGTWFGESNYGLSYITRALLTFNDATGALESTEVRLIPLWTDTVGEAPAVLKTVAGFAADVEREMGQTVGEAAADLEFSADGLDSGLGNLFCDLTLEATGADLAFHNTKALRAQIRKGAVRLRDLYQVMPFDNTIVTMRLTGAQVRRLLTDNLRNNWSAIQVAGLEVAYRPGPGDKPAKLSVKRNGREIKDKDIFTVATNSYLAGGGNNGEALDAGLDRRDTMLPARELFIKAFGAGPVTAPATGRIRRIK
jgi:2',3'-cyclic-nucleotide 2'-phosphodiesterase (5'-nucleotidase family)